MQKYRARQASLVLFLAVLPILLSGADLLAYSQGGPSGGAHRCLVELALRRLAREAAGDPAFSASDLLPAAAEYGLDTAAFERLFLLRGSAVIETRWFSYREEERSGDFLFWLREGGYAADAPEVPMGMRHFYDPVRANGPTWVTDWVGRLFSPRVDAVEWALSASPRAWRVGRENLRQALACPDGEKRRLLFAAAWRSLGEVLHILADQTVPAHTRNDAHALRDEDPYEQYIGATWITGFAAGPAGMAGPDPELARALATSRSPAEVFHAVAAYTNAHFFSDDTIAGRDPAGGRLLRNRNGERPYPLPSLADCAYDPATGRYTARDYLGELLVAERDARRGPSLSRACVESQAQRLVPAAVAAGARLLALCLPRFQVVLDGAEGAGRTLRGRLTTLEAGEDGSLRPFPAVVAPEEALLMIRVGERQSTLVCPIRPTDRAGGFALDLPEEALLSGGEVSLAFVLGGIVVRSPAL